VPRVFDRPITISSFPGKFRLLACDDGSPPAKPHVQFLCSTENRFFVPTALLAVRRAQPRSRIAERSGATAARGAAGVLDGGEHGAQA